MAKKQSFVEEFTYEQMVFEISKEMRPDEIERGFEFVEVQNPVRVPQYMMMQVQNLKKKTVPKMFPEQLRKLRADKAELVPLLNKYKNTNSKLYEFEFEQWEKMSLVMNSPYSGCPLMGQRKDGGVGKFIGDQFLFKQACELVLSHYIATAKKDPTGVRTAYEKKSLPRGTQTGLGIMVPGSDLYNNCYVVSLIQSLKVQKGVESMKELESNFLSIMREFGFSLDHIPNAAGIRKQGQRKTQWLLKHTPSGVMKEIGFKNLARPRMIYPVAKHVSAYNKSACNGLLGVLKLDPQHGFYDDEIQRWVEECEKLGYEIWATDYSEFDNSWHGFISDEVNQLIEAMSLKILGVKMDIKWEQNRSTLIPNRSTSKGAELMYSGNKLTSGASYTTLKNNVGNRTLKTYAKLKFELKFGRPPNIKWICFGDDVLMAGPNRSEIENFIACESECGITTTLLEAPVFLMQFYDPNKKASEHHGSICRRIHKMREPEYPKLLESIRILSTYDSVKALGPHPDLDFMIYKVDRDPDVFAGNGNRKWKDIQAYVESGDAMKQLTVDMKKTIANALAVQAFIGNLTRGAGQLWGDIATVMGVDASQYEEFTPRYDLRDPMGKLLQIFRAQMTSPAMFKDYLTRTSSSDKFKLEFLNSLGPNPELGNPFIKDDNISIED